MFPPVASRVETGGEKMKKLISLILAAALCGCAGCGPNEEDKEVYNTTENLMDYDAKRQTEVAEVLAWRAPAPTDEQYTLMKECGVTTVLMDRTTGVMGDDVHKAHFDAAERNGLQIIGFPGYLGNFEQPGGDYKHYNSMAGILYADEPSVDQFQQIREQIPWFEANYPDKIFYTNLHPSSGLYATGIEPGQTYVDYIDRYCSEVLSQVSAPESRWLSADVYPLHVKSGRYMLDQTWLYDLAVIATKGAEYDCHTAMCIQAGSFESETNKLHSKVPDERDIRLQVMTSLAFGIRSIALWTYAPSYVDFWATTALIDGAGKPTEVYESVQTVIGELHAADHIYRSFEWQGVYPLRVDRSRDKEAFAALNTVKNALVTPEEYMNEFTAIESDNNAVVGYFTDNNANEAVLAVNFGETTENIAATIKFSFKKSDRALVIRKGEVSTVTVADKALEVKLEPGEGIFVLPYKA